MVSSLIFSKSFGGLFTLKNALTFIAGRFHDVDRIFIFITTFYSLKLDLLPEFIK